MNIQIILTSIIYVAIVILVAIRPGSIIFNHKDVKNPILRSLIMAIIFPITGALLWLVGWLVKLLGGLMISPFAYIIN